ncbi:M43 family zinc metalloprotease [Chitinophaga sp. Hz27]|uniref:M43 family zinc metalloprotease n=1 Tax=Chitinophaga sp. Hz27 TaxID=3347169 RepID=UPI0035E3889F
MRIPNEKLACMARCLILLLCLILPLVSKAQQPPVTLPVVVHIISDNPQSITDAMIIQGIKELNEAYSATGAFTGGRTNTGIQFCLAHTAPDGSSTTGITRVKSYLTDFDDDLEADRITKLGRWDASRYINIWLVSDIKSEFMQLFECGQWTRLKKGGYAGPGGDVVVSSMGAGILAHEMGHYLNLLHTFGNMDCKNDDCTIDGDQVCDTPPDKTITGGYTCSNPPNSCSTDTLSGFGTDVPDLPDNFMDYGNGTGCILGFTQGQANRMHAFINSSLTGMINSTLCNDPCAGGVVAAFTRDKDYPLLGDNVSFTNTSVGSASWQWLVDNVPVSTAANYVLNVTDKRNYYVTLKATSGGCSTLYTDVVEVSCGVVARFTPSKRKIASKTSEETDQITFTNRSRNATSYKWYMSSDSGMPEQIISTDQDFTYTFPEPGIYDVWLIATDGHCTDTTKTLHVTVDDPTPDVAVYVTKVECYQQDQLKVSFFLHNFGYKTISKGMPIAFYDRKPTDPGAIQLGSLYLMPGDLTGKCSTPLYTTTVNAGIAGLDSIVVVAADNGSTSPLVLPNTGLTEQKYTNNIATFKNIRFKPVLDAADVFVKPLANIDLTAHTIHGTASSMKWIPTDNLSCDNCSTTTFTAPYRQDTVTIRQVIAFSNQGCYDTATATIHIPVADDYTAKIDQLTCASNNRLHVRFTICNNFIQGTVPAGLVIRFYDADPDLGLAHQLGNDFTTTNFSTTACNTYEHFISNAATGKVFVKISTDRLLKYPVASGLEETDYDNNTGNTDYTPPVLNLMPADTTVFRKDQFPLYFNTTLDLPYNIAWSQAPAYTLTCNSCATPLAAMKDSDLIHVALTNQYGCVLRDTANIHIFPPDFIVELQDAQCFDDSRIIVSFKICMHNGYDSVFAKLPVAFYDAGTGKLLGNVFYTMSRQAGNCYVYTHLLPKPQNGTKVVAVVNNNVQINESGIPETVFKETDYNNNSANTLYIPFSVKVTPSISDVLRPAQVPLVTTVTGGTPFSYSWTPAEGLSCTTCPQPTATIKSSLSYQVAVQNAYYCIATAATAFQSSILERTSMPTAFTPNGDGQNDIFYVIGSRDIVMVKSFNIFNRMGNKVFEASNTPANDKAYGWNGMVNGRQANMDSYVYFALLTFTDGTTQLIKGSFVLLR